MGLEYYSEQEIKDNKYIILNVLEKETYFVKSGIQFEQFITFVKDKESKILDIGCGPGNFAKKLIGAGYENIHLVDIDNYLNDDIQNKVFFSKKNVCFESLDYQGESFDTVMMLAVLEHLENPFFPVREVSRVLKPGGVFFLSIPWIFNLRSKWKFLWKGDIKGYSEKNNHIALFTRAIMKKMIFKDFEIQNIVYSKGYVKFFQKEVKFESKYLCKLFGDKVLYVLRKK